MEIRRVGADEVDAVLAAGGLFDEPSRRDWTERFLTTPGHHLLFAWVDGVAAGFISGVETTHPDKGTELFLYELGVDEAFQGRGIGRALVEALAAHARALGCHGMWVATEPDNEAAIRTYRSAGSGEPEASVVLTWDFEKSSDFL